MRDEQVGKGRARPLGNQRKPVFADHDRIHHQGKGESGGPAGHSGNDALVTERARFCSMRRDVFKNRIELGSHQLGGQQFDRFDVLRVLDRHQGQDAHGVHTQLVERLDVGLDPSAARRVGTGNGQCNGNHDFTISNRRDLKDHK